ncbi:MAG: hypothetical protein P8H05_03670 [Schleiferiaceae bacterium]|nr:hypothetical protein [Schleiferiaceae bacterium]
MIKFFFLLYLCLGLSLFSQTRLQDGTWEDQELSFSLIHEEIKENGFLELCISKNGVCIENLTVGFTIVIFDKMGKEILNSLWTGKNMNLSFKRAYPEAKEILIKAGAPFVINKISGTRIRTGHSLKLHKTLK